MFWKHRRSFRKAQCALESNDYVEAEKALDEILGQDDEAIEALLHRSLTRLRLKKLDAALGDAESVVKLRPESALGFMVAGEVLLAMRRFEEAYSRFEMACKLERDNGRAFLGWAKACLGLQKKEEAADYIETALQFERDYVFAQLFAEVLSR